MQESLLGCARDKVGLRLGRGAAASGVQGHVIDAAPRLNEDQRAALWLFAGSYRAHYTHGERSAAGVVKRCARDLVIVSRTAALAPRDCPRCMVHRHVAIGPQAFPTKVG
jgi:hypothetical protein